MSHLVAFARFCWDFVVGDDWKAAASAAAAVGITTALAHNSVNAWWLLPPSVLAITYLSVRRATRAR